MEELIKLLVDLLVLGDSARKGTFSWLTLCVGFAVIGVIGAAVLGALSYAGRHPGAGADRLIIAALVFAGLALIATLIWGWRYQQRLAARRAVTH